MTLTSLIEVELSGLEENSIYAKCELDNVTGSHKYRVYRAILDALGKHETAPTLIDFSSGNGGAALARLAKERGYRAKIFVPSQIPTEKKEKITHYGGEIIEVPSSASYGHYGPEDLLTARLHAAQAAQQEGAIFLDQANNPANIQGCRQIGEEIVTQLDGKKPDYFVCGIGTGGTITGVAQILKEYNPNITIIGVEPVESNTLEAKLHCTKPRHATHQLAGLGMGSLHSATDSSLIDDIVLVTEQEWRASLNELADAGIGAGKSSAANIAATRKVLAGKHAKTCVTILFDSNTNYESEQTPQIICPDVGIIDNYQQTWDALFMDDEFQLRTEPDPALTRIHRRLTEQGICHLASVACGDGINEAWLQEHGIHIEGYDLSAIALGLARKNAPEVQFYEHDLLKQPLNTCYAAAQALDISMHLDDESLLVMLEHLHASLQPGAPLYMNFLTPEDETARALPEWQRTTYVNQGQVLITYRSEQEVRELIRNTGFHINETSAYQRTDKPHANFRKKDTEHTHKGLLVELTRDFASINEALEATRTGQPLLILDHRENEGDIYVAAECATEENVAFMLRHGGGVYCVSMLPKRFEELRIESASKRAMNENETRFGEPIDYLVGTTTGVSAYDRAATTQSVASDATKPYQLRRNGHVRTLEAHPQGILARHGHTEAAVELASQAGLYPAGAIMEVLNEDGKLAREDELIALSKNTGVPLVQIGQLVQYRKRQ